VGLRPYVNEDETFWADSSAWRQFPVEFSGTQDIEARNFVDLLSELTTKSVEPHGSDNKGGPDMAAYMFDDKNLPVDLDVLVRSELSDGERLLWVGQPRPSRIAYGAIPLVLFGIPWTAFALFWVAMSYTMSGGFNQVNGGPAPFGVFRFFPLFGLPFVLIGLGMLSSPYWLWRQAKRTCYALTDRRAILWKAGMFGSVTVRSYGPEALDRVTRTSYADGCGDLVFEEVVTAGTDSEGRRTARTSRYGFMAIKQVREVEELLRKSLRSRGDEGRPV
jgi:hypothetical protein